MKPDSSDRCALSRLRSARNAARRQLRRKFLFEAPEPRVLLNSDLTFAMGTEASDLTLRMQNVSGTATLQVVDNGTHDVLASQTLADTSAVVIIGGAENDKLTVDFSNPFSTPVSFTDASASDQDTLSIIGGDRTWNITGTDAGNSGPVTFSGIEGIIGGAGLDTLVGPDAATTWQLSGPDSGSVNGLAFTGVENISGGSAADEFAVGVSGSLSGTLDGGGGTNTLDYSSALSLGDC